MNFGVIVNERSGSVPEGGRALLEEAIRRAGHGVVFTGQDSDAADFGELTLTAMQAGVDAICVWGGDGTIAAVLQSAGKDIPILLLPGGTMNLLPKRLHDGQLDWRKVLDATLSDPKRRSISAGQVGGKRFYVAAMFGQLTKLGESREAAREGGLLEAVEILTSADALDIECQLQISVDGRDGERNFPAAAAAVVPGEDSGLELAVIAPDSHLDLVAAALDAAVRGWRDGAHFHTNGASRIRIDRENGQPIPATMDGEPCTIAACLDIRYIPDAACVLVAGAGA